MGTPSQLLCLLLAPSELLAAMMAAVLVLPELAPHESGALSVHTTPLSLW